MEVSIWIEFDLVSSFLASFKFPGFAFELDDVTRSILFFVFTLCDCSEAYVNLVIMDGVSVGLAGFSLIIYGVKNFGLCQSVSWSSKNCFSIRPMLELLSRGGYNSNQMLLFLKIREIVSGAGFSIRYYPHSCLNLFKRFKGLVCPLYIPNVGPSRKGVIYTSSWCRFNAREGLNM